MVDEKLSRRMREVIAGDDIEMRNVSKSTKISRTTLYRILYDEKYDPRYSTIKSLCSYLKINLNEYIYEK